MKVGAIVVLYHPEQDVITKLKTYSKYNIDFVFVDNSIDYDEGDDNFNDFNIIHNKNNGGIAGAINKGVEFLINKDVELIFTFDQDSIIPDDFFDKMQAFANEKNAKIICPNFFDTNSRTYATFVTLSRWKYSVEKSASTTAFAISSGMGFTADVWGEIGQLNEKYIIDHVDTDFCLRAHDRGIKIYINHNICLNHEIGKREVHKLLGVTIKPNNHNHIRKYYISRNGTHLALKYIFKYPSYFYLNVLRIVHELVCVIFYEKEKKKKTVAILRGLVDAVSGRLGMF